VLLRGTLVDWSSWELGLAASDSARLVDEVLEQIAIVLCQEQDFCLLNDVA